MRRGISFFLCIALFLCLNACSSRQEDIINPVSFYYLQVQPAGQIFHGSAESVIAPEIREGHGFSDHLSMLLEQYLTGPVEENLQSPFPAGTTLIEWDADDDVLSITLSDQLAELTGVDLTLACACLSKTCFAYDDYSTVSIQAQNLLLDGKASITMEVNTLLMLDETISGTEPDNP